MNGGSGVSPARAALTIVAAWFLVSCATYEREFYQAARYAESEQYDRALALLRALEPDVDALRSADRTRYYYYRALIDYRLASPVYPVRPEARYWFALAKASETLNPGALRTAQKEQIAKALEDLMQDVYMKKKGAPPSDPAKR